MPLGQGGQAQSEAGHSGKAAVGPGLPTTCFSSFSLALSLRNDSEEQLR